MFNETRMERVNARHVKGLVYIEFDAVDAWFEEEEQIFVHPKDPYKVSRCRITISVAGAQVAHQGAPFAARRRPSIVTPRSR